MALKKELFIASSKLVEFDGKTSIPTSVYYTGGGPLTGHPALAAAENPADVNDNFKLELGRVAPGRLEPPRFGNADGKSRSANEISRDFIQSVLTRTEEWISLNGYKQADRVLVAEPLSMDKSSISSDDWLANYRQRVKAILSPKFKEVDFLPEPFAVFQYYRYGVKHPLVSGAAKHVALVLDFGGGTFDVSVVETTIAGDVSASGRNSRPLSAASIPVGGYFINREIARELINEHLAKGTDKSLIQRAWKAFDEYGAEKAKDSFALREDFLNFIRNVRKFLSGIESAKINICTLLNDWRLGAEYKSCPGAQIQIPTSPMSLNPALINVRFDAYYLRKIFVERVWRNRLKQTIVNAIDRANDELSGKPITVVLLSGGSSNIRWLNELIKNELSHLLPHAEPVELREDFQEVVAKGLAIECARRTFNGSGDFHATTYNRLCLALSADNEHPKGFSYKILEQEFEGAKLDEGVLLPSASLLANHIGRPLRWKVKLPHPPKKQLDYYFLKSSLDFDDMASLHNVEHRVHTPANCSFDPSIQIELTVKADGTAIPKFIYRQGWGASKSITAEGTPFYMDMTVGEENSVGEAYLGFDFGSSNSSMSYVEQDSVRVFTQRSGEKHWLDLNDLISVLPYPVAYPLAKFVAAASQEELGKNFGGVLEAMLMFIGYVSYSDHCVMKSDRETKVFKSFTKASAGPLWDLCKKCIDYAVPNSVSITFRRLLEESNFQLVDSSIAFVNDLKHHRTPPPLDFHRVLNLLGNSILRAMKDKVLGTFEGIVRMPFSSQYQGTFRALSGSHGPFIDSYEYLGSQSFSEQEVFLVDVETGFALSLAPLMFWIGRTSSDEPRLAIFDSIGKEIAEYRSVSGGQGITVDTKNELRGLVNMCTEMSGSDPKRSFYTGLSLKRRSRSD